MKPLLVVIFTILSLIGNIVNASDDVKVWYKVWYVDHFGRIQSTNDILKEMDQLGYRPAKQKELSAYIKTNHDWYKKESKVILVSLSAFDSLGKRYPIAVADGKKFKEGSLPTSSVERMLKACAYLAVRK